MIVYRSESAQRAESHNFAQYFLVLDTFDIQGIHGCCNKCSILYLYVNIFVLRRSNSTTLTPSKNIHLCLQYLFMRDSLLH